MSLLAYSDSEDSGDDSDVGGSKNAPPVTIETATGGVTSLLGDYGSPTAQESNPSLSTEKIEPPAFSLRAEPKPTVPVISPNERISGVRDTEEGETITMRISGVQDDIIEQDPAEIRKACEFDIKIPFCRTNTRLVLSRRPIGQKGDDKNLLPDIPTSPKGKPNKEAQKRIKELLANHVAESTSFNSILRRHKRKDGQTVHKNPCILKKTCDIFEIDQYHSNLSKSYWNPEIFAQPKHNYKAVQKQVESRLARKKAAGARKQEKEASRMRGQPRSHEDPGLLRQGADHLQQLRAQIMRKKRAQDSAMASLNKKRRR